ncbi:MAG: flagellar filament capping protein FliD, partial [Pseudorhodobacter sp.]|nr:flagellar filament capping protein FliD [Frankiaceae bacterium]
MAITLGGLGSGLDTNQIISQLMQVERLPLQRLDTQRTQFQAQARAWTEMSTQLTALRGTADALKTPATALITKPTSTDPLRVAVSGGLSAATGSTTFRVTSLATAHQVSSVGFTGTSSVVGAGTFTVTAGTASLGATAAQAQAGLAAGVHTLVVTQASSGAAVTGSTLSLPYTPQVGSNVLTAQLAGGVTATATLDASATYSTLDELAVALTAAFGGGAVARADGGHLVVSSETEGSASALTLSGSAVASLGLGASTAAGQDAVLTLDGTSQTVTDFSGPIDVGGVLALTAKGLRAGTGTVGVVRTTDPATTLADLASSVNSLPGVAGASAIDTGSSSSPARLVLTARDTGTAGRLTLSAVGFSGLPDSFSALRAAQDATVVLGDPAGPNPLIVRRSSNTITDLVPGVTVTLTRADPATDVTVAVNRDTESMATKYKAMIDNANALLDSVAKNTRYDLGTRSGGPLVGDSRARDLSPRLYSVFYASTGSGSLSSLSAIGIGTSREGRFTFDA